MTLGLFLAIGESLGDFKSKGQLKRLINYNIYKYSQVFEKVYIFSYADEQYNLPKNFELVPNKFHIHRFIYTFLIPIINYRLVKECNVLRGLQITGGIPTFVSKILYKKRFVINYGYDYSSFARTEKKYFQALFYTIIKEPILFMADRVIVPSKTIAQRLKKKFKNKIVYIPNGVDTKLFHPAKNKPKNKILQLVFIGRIEEQKNLINLIKAAKHLKMPYDLIFYGQGSKSEQLTKLAKKLKVPLQIKKPIDYQNVAKILRTCDIFVLPSHKEGSPKILLEALASGCAVVVSNIPQITEIITDGKTGVVSPQESQKLTKAINKLQDHTLRQKMGREARKLVINKYEINKLLSQEVNILKKLSQ